MTGQRKATNLTGLSGLDHGFFTRNGGVSEGLYQSLNCGAGSDDDPAAVAENRKRVVAALDGADSLCTLYQIHSADVMTVTEPFDHNSAPKADGMVTNRTGLVLGILTADCVPVLFADSNARVIGAAHAGWKGAIGGVLGNAVTAMCALGANVDHIQAAIGPAIAQASYEVGPELRNIYLGRDAAFSRFFRESGRPGHFLFDLTGFVEQGLQQAGVQDIERLDQDTYKNADQFYSYRRSTHRNEPDYGRQISAIVLS